MKRIFGSGRYANVTSTAALVIALGGTSYAAIKLPANSVTSKTVKDKSLLKKDFKPGQLKAGPKGATGAPGAAGATGATGPQGPAGTNGITPAGFSASTPAAQAFAAGNVTVQTLSLPAGKYIVAAHTVAHNSDAAADVVIKCALNLGATEIDSLGGLGDDLPPAVAPITDTSVGLVGAASLAAAGTATLVCSTSATTGNYLQRNITAVQVGTLNGA